MERQECFHCTKDQRLQDLMLEVQELSVSTLYLFKEQTYKGRCLVSFKGHKNELFELTETELGLFAQDLARAAQAVKTVFQADNINYGAYSDKLPHLHFHLVPKVQDGPDWGGMFTMMPAPQHLLTAAEYETMLAALRRQLA